MKKKLHRSSKNKIIAGVCVGIAETYGFDPTVVRLVTVLLAFLSWGGGPLVILAYIVAWIIMPEEGEEKVEMPESEKQST